jgi:hypothetical protein
MKIWLAFIGFDVLENQQLVGLVMWIPGVVAT